MLTERLNVVLQMISGAHTMADIGTDHAYLPIEAIRMRLCKNAIACDVNTGPLEIAAANIRGAGFNSVIETRLGNGLMPIALGEADCITICGMGGALIIKILDQEPEKARCAKKIILQPQHNKEELRRYLHSTGFYFEEVLAVENSRFYTIIFATHTGEAYTHTCAEYFLGQIEPGPNFTKYLHHQHEKISRYIQQITDISTRDKVAEKLRWIKERLS